MFMPLFRLISLLHAASTTQIAVQTYQLVSGRICPEVFHALSPGIVQSARTHQERAQYRTIIRIGYESVLVVVLGGVVHQVVDNLRQLLIEKGQPINFT